MSAKPKIAPPRQKNTTISPARKPRHYHKVDTEPLEWAIIELPDWVGGAD